MTNAFLYAFSGYCLLIINLLINLSMLLIFYFAENIAVNSNHAVEVRTSIG